MTDELRVAAVQMSSQDDVDANLATASRLIAEAGAAGAKLVLLPENFAYMGTEEGKREIAEVCDEGGSSHGPVLQALAQAARAANVHVCAGGMPERSSDPARPYNACVLVAPDGALVAKYRKVHLFDVDVGEQKYRESASTSAGSTPTVATVGGFVVGLSICYDLRFPELYRKLCDRGAEVIVVPAAFTVVTGKDHWHVLLRARAIESQAYVIAAAQFGQHPRGRSTYGKSLVADPWGDVIAQCSDGEGLVVTSLSRAYLARVRGKLPSLQHRRL
jgi:predicted amidohydrolase